MAPLQIAPMFAAISSFLVALLRKLSQLLWLRVYSISKQVQSYESVRYPSTPLSPLSQYRLNMIAKKTLVLDLDETLIHSHHDGIARPTQRINSPPDFVIQVDIDGHPVRFYVHKRPHVDYFLNTIAQWYNLVVFTASMEIYGSAVANDLEKGKNKLFDKRYFRQHCHFDYSGYVKNLSMIESDLNSIFILDNSPGAYRGFPDNGMPIKSWFGDPSDVCLLNLLPVLDALRFVTDVRSILRNNVESRLIRRVVDY